MATRQPQTEMLLNEIGTPELLIQPDDPQALADALEALAADPERVKRIGQAARELSIRKYTWRRAVTDTFAEIENIAAERNGQPAMKAAL